MFTRMCLAGLAVWAILAGLGQANAADPATKVTLYHSDPSHLWNRLHATLLVRQGPDGKGYGADRLEPLLWLHSNSLLNGSQAEAAATVLDEFEREKGATLIREPLPRAILQRDLWLLANWAAQADDERAPALLKRLARAIQQVALSREEISTLPDNYQQAIASREFAERYEPERPKQGYLPRDLFEPQGPWVCLGREDGPTAPFHLLGSNAFNNSTFLIFLKLPGGRAATLEFVKQLTAFTEPLYVANPDSETQSSFRNLPNPALPQWPKGTEVALVRRALLIDSKGAVVASPLTESVQLRVMRIETPPLTVKTLRELESGLSGDIVNGIKAPNTPNRAVDAQAFFEFQLRRSELFAGRSGGLRDVSAERDFKTGFNAHLWDEFTDERRATDPFPERSQPFQNNRASCIGCHRYPGVYSFNSFHSMFPFALQRQLSRDGEDEGSVTKSNRLAVMSIDAVEQAAVKFRQRNEAWPKLPK